MNMLFYSNVLYTTDCLSNKQIIRRKDKKGNV